MLTLRKYTRQQRASDSPACHRSDARNKSRTARHTAINANTTAKLATPSAANEPGNPAYQGRFLPKLRLTATTASMSESAIRTGNMRCPLLWEIRKATKCTCPPLPMPHGKSAHRHRHDTTLRASLLASTSTGARDVFRPVLTLIAPETVSGWPLAVFPGSLHHTAFDAAILLALRALMAGIQLSALIVRSVGFNDTGHAHKRRENRRWAGLGP